MVAACAVPSAQRKLIKLKLIKLNVCGHKLSCCLRFHNWKIIQLIVLDDCSRHGRSLVSAPKYESLQNEWHGVTVVLNGLITVGITLPLHGMYAMLIHITFSIGCEMSFRRVQFTCPFSPSIYELKWFHLCRVLDWYALVKLTDSNCVKVDYGYEMGISSVKLTTSFSHLPSNRPLDHLVLS